MADMAGLLACQSCTEMACAMRTALPGQLLSGPGIGNPGMDGSEPAPHDNSNGSKQTKPAAQGQGDTAVAEATNRSTPSAVTIQPSGAGGDPAMWATPRSSMLPTVPELSSSNEASGSADGASRVGSAAAGAVERASRKVSGGTWDMRSQGAPDMPSAVPNSSKGGPASVLNNSSSPLRTSPRSSPPAVSSSSAPEQQTHPSPPPNEYLVGGAAPPHGQQQQMHKQGTAQQSGALGIGAASELQQGSAPAALEPDSPPPRMRKKRGLCGLF
ncbi:hypothetical protein DUNSADRAFT_4443 [Dunaliella salina]|nr:hypothetical protein DUNSADRAFT_4443 [Dunaliella salina]|eukprot:KAF5837395.1 hypothetical protein DUNSADRAFT_4443 [Dunaliella salina]